MKKTKRVYSDNIFFLVLKDFIYFPYWWYREGLLELSKKIKKFLISRERSLAFFVWVKNIFVPMYDQKDFAGRMISFFIRLVQIIFRGSVMLFYLALTFFILLFYIFWPFFMVFGIFNQLT